MSECNSDFPYKDCTDPVDPDSTCNNPEILAKYLKCQQLGRINEQTQDALLQMRYALECDNQILQSLAFHKLFETYLKLLGEIVDSLRTLGDKVNPSESHHD